MIRLGMCDADIQDPELPNLADRPERFEPAPRQTADSGAVGAL